MCSFSKRIMKCIEMLEMVVSNIKNIGTPTQMVGITWYRHHRTIIYSIPNHAFYHEMDPILTNYWPQVWKNTCLGSNFHCPVPTRPCPHLASVNCGRALQRAGSTSPAETQEILWISPKNVKLWVLSKKTEPELTNQKRWCPVCSQV